MDPIADFLTRIRNAGMAQHSKVDIPTSRTLVGIASVLKKNAYIKDFKVATQTLKKSQNSYGLMRIYLSYSQDKKPTISKIIRMSRPGKRLYKKSDQIPEVRSGFGLAIFSTNQGIMSGKEAKKSNLGGEFLCQVW